MRRDPLVDPQDVTVEVTNGVFTLTGTVPTWSARQAADSAASFTDGVTEVHNELRIAL